MENTSKSYYPFLLRTEKRLINQCDGEIIGERYNDETARSSERQRFPFNYLREKCAALFKIALYCLELSAHYFLKFNSTTINNFVVGIADICVVEFDIFYALILQILYKS